MPTVRAAIRALALVVLTAALAGVPALLAASSWREVQAPGPAGPACALGLAASAAALVAAGWLLLAVTASAVDGVRLVRADANAAAAASSELGWRSGGAARTVAPGLVRRLVLLVVTASLMSPSAAMAAGQGRVSTGASSGPPAVVASATAPDLSPGWLPEPTSAVTPPPVTGPSSPAPSSSSPAPSLAPVGPPGPALRPSQVQRSDVVVRRGDTLWSIAGDYLGPGATAAQILATWPAWYAANRAVIGDDPNLIRPGMRLRPPQADEPTNPATTGATSTARGGTGGSR